MTVPTPELDRRSKVLEESQKIGEFIDWLRGDGWQIAKYESRSGMESCPGYLMMSCDRGILRRGTHKEQVCPRCDGMGETLVQREDWCTDTRSIEQLLADYFKIDLNKVEVERRAILTELQKRNDEVRPVVS